MDAISTLTAVEREELINALIEAEAALEISVSVIETHAKKCDWPTSSPRMGLKIVQGVLAKHRANPAQPATK